MYCTTKKMVNGIIRDAKKKTYATMDEAIEEARKMNSYSHIIHKLVAYKCPDCHQYHIGRSKKVLTEEEKEHYRNMGKFNRIWNKTHNS